MTSLTLETLTAGSSFYLTMYGNRELCITKPFELRHAWSNFDFPHGEPKIDFQTEMVAGVILGNYEKANYAVRISEAIHRGNLRR